MTDPVTEAYELIAQGRPLDALALLEPLGQRPDASHGQLAAYAEALKLARRDEEALAVYQRAVAVAPRSGVAEHNLAALQGDLGHHQAAEAAARRAFAKGLDAPETWLVLGRALQGQHRHDEAEAAYGEALRRRPTMAEAHYDLAQLIWMRSEDAQAATVVLRAATRAYPDEPALAFQLAGALRAAGDDDGAYSALLAAIARWSEPVAPLEIAASGAAAALKETVAAQRHAERAVQATPDNLEATLALADAHLGFGRAGPAARLAEALLAKAPDDQRALARLATAWRLMDDPRYGALYDYGRFVREMTLEAPAGWPSLGTWLVDLAAALSAAHSFRAHPFGQSLRGGARAHTDPRRSDDPAVQGFFGAIEAPIQAYIVGLGEGDDPLSRRNTGARVFAGAWSIRTRPGGRQLDHIDQPGWISGVCWIDPLEPSPGREGWLQLGEPGVPTQPKLGAERFIAPAPGRLVLFPSYMWQGTLPLAGEADVLSIAFDLIPA